MAECKMNPEQVFKLIPDHVSEYARPYIRDHIKDLRARIAELEAENKRLREALSRIRIRLGNMLPWAEKNTFLQDLKCLDETAYAALEETK